MVTKNLLLRSLPIFLICSGTSLAAPKSHSPTPVSPPLSQKLSTTLSKKEESWARKLEDTYLPYLESQLFLWKAERLEQGQISLNTSTLDLTAARDKFRHHSDRLDETILAASKEPSIWVQSLSQNLRLVRQSWLNQSQSPVELQLLSLDFLQRSYQPEESRRFSLLKWQMLRGLYGQSVEERLLEESFAIRDWEQVAGALTTGRSRIKYKVLVVKDPWKDLGGQVSHLPEYQQLLEASAAQDALIKTLQDQKIPFESIETGDTEDLELQVAQLMHFLRKHQKDLDTKLVVLSTGHGSALVHKLLDTYPELRQTPKIAAWINWNGRLYGMPLRESNYRQIVQHAQKQKGRALASVATPWELTPEKRFFEKVTQEQLNSYQKVLPLGEGFPIFSLLPAEYSQRTTPELRESLVLGGESFFVENTEQTAPKVLLDLIAQATAAN